MDSITLGAHCYIFTDCWTDASLPLLENARKLGLECLDIAVGDDIIFDMNAVRIEAGEVGMQLAISPGGHWPLACDLSSPDPAERRAGIDWHQAQIDKAAAMGAFVYGGCIYGHVGVVKKERPDPDALYRMAEGLRTLGTYGQDRGVELAIEPMSHFRTHLVNTPEQARALLNETDHPNVNVLLDTYHMVTEVTDYRSGIQAVADRLWGMHVCESNRGVPGRGIIPWQDVFQALVEIDFSGYLMLESYNSGIGDFAYERGMFHHVCADSEAFIKEGIQFIRSRLDDARPIH